MISVEGSPLLPFEYQLNLFDGVGCVIGVANSIDLLAYLEVSLVLPCFLS